MKRVVVIGAGIAGLSSAYEIIERSTRIPGGLEVEVLEAEPRPGGNIRTEEFEGYRIENGPNGFLDNVPATLDLVRRLGLEERLLPSSADASKRFLFRNGRLLRIPEGPKTFLMSPILPLRGRLRVLLEPFARGHPGGDETIFDFASRRIGREAARVLVDAMVSGVYAGDARQLSLRSCFPRMHRMEMDHGSLFRALLALKRRARRTGQRAGGPAGPGGRLTSFEGGLQDLIDALARHVGDRLRTGFRAGEIRRDHGGYAILGDDRSGSPGGKATVRADAVVVATPARDAAPILEGLRADLAGILREIPSAGLAVVATGYDASRWPRDLAGFGFLAPRGEGLRILGCLWSSWIFPGKRSPEGKILVRTMIGGAHDPGAVSLPDDELITCVRRELTEAMGLRGEPDWVRIYRYLLGIPQYTLGHDERLRRIEGILAETPGLFVTGNSYRGIALNSCVQEAGPVAESVVGLLA